MKRFVSMLAAALVCAASFAQEASIKWSSEVEHIGGQDYRIVFSGKIADGLHTYGSEDGFSPTTVSFDKLTGCSLKGKVYDLEGSRVEDGMIVFHKNIRIAQDLTLNAKEASLEAEINWQSCDLTSCLIPEHTVIGITVVADGTAGTEEAGIPEGSVTESSIEESHSTPIGSPEEEKGFNWAMLIEAILWGFAALLTPCVFPMVPMTVSFFMKGSSSPAAGRFKASMYGLFIVLLYTVPISLIILITRIAGGDAVTADIFNWLATHWIPNIIFFIVFMIFAASFFGAFEIVLPSSLVNRSDKGADKGGLLGIFFMALTLVLVSFSCTGP
ncbi:MAG: thiol:disulfide interchange protein, partial [Candidatus Cryptobacteroides sp.]